MHAEKKMILKEGNFQKKVLVMGESGGEGGPLFCKLPLLFDLDQEEQEVVQHFTSEVNTPNLINWGNMIGLIKMLQGEKRKGS